MKSAENASTDDDTARHWRIRHRRLQLKRPMGTILVVIAHELGEQREQMPLIQHDDMIKAFLAKGSHYSLRDGVRQRRPVRRSDLSDASAGELGPEVAPVYLVSVTDQVSWLMAPGGSFDHLPPDPGRRRVRGDIEMNQLPALVADEEEDIEGLEADR